MTENLEAAASGETVTPSRRHSFTLVSRRSESETEQETDEEVNPRTRKRSSSVSETPYKYGGIPLGSRVAQEAAKSFWNMDMFQQSLNKIVMYAADGSSGLGSSLESVDMQASNNLTPPPDNGDLTQPSVGVDTEKENQSIVFSPVAPHLRNFPLAMISCSAPTSPTQPRYSIHRSQSDCSSISTSPTISPRHSVYRSKSDFSESPTKQPSCNCRKQSCRRVAVYDSPLQHLQLQAELSQSLVSSSAHDSSVVDGKIHLVEKYSRQVTE